MRLAIAEGILRLTIQAKTNNLEFPNTVKPYGNGLSGNGGRVAKKRIIAILTQDNFADHSASYTGRQSVLRLGSREASVVTVPGSVDKAAFCI